MSTQGDPARHFMRLFGETYALLHRRLRPTLTVTPEGRGLLLHMAYAGPLSIGELALHTDRAQSVVSETVDVLESRELVARVRDPRDRRRTLVWLTDRARQWLTEEQEPLDRERIETVLLAMDPSERERLLVSFEQFIAAAEQIRKRSVESASGDRVAVQDAPPSELRSVPAEHAKRSDHCAAKAAERDEHQCNEKT